MKKAKLVILALFLLFFSSITGTICEETNSIYIKIYEDGSALWNLETRFELKTQADIDFFNEYTSVLEDDKDLIVQEKKESLQEIINSVAYSSGREMGIENISLNYQTLESINKKYGIVTFKFLWKEFGVKDKNSIVVGDAFSEGSFIKEGEVLVIEYPKITQFTVFTLNQVKKEKKLYSGMGQKFY